MATYATFAEVVNRYGASALTAMVPADVIGNPDDLETLTGEAQLEAAAEIDMALGSCGYVTPVDTSSIADPDQKARAEAFLRRLETGLTVAALSRGEVGKVLKSRSDKEAGAASYSFAESTVTWSRDQLEKLCAKTSSIPGIPAPGRTFVHVGDLSVPDSAVVDRRLEVAGTW